MNRNRFLLLVAVTLAAVVLVALLGRPGGSTDDAVPETLLPALAGSVNDVEAVDIVAPGGRVTVSLRRDEERWRVVQKDGYEAEFAQVLELLRTLAEVRIVEPKTSKPAWYPQLGVQDVTDPDATGRRLDFPGRDIASVIVGQSDPSGEGSYARRAGEERSWLLDEIVEVPVDPVAWLEPGVMDIPSGDIAEVIVRHPDGETVQLKGVGDQDRSFVLMGVPEGREAGESFKRNALANGLRSLNLEDVRRFEPPAPADRVRVLFTTTDGLNFVAEVFERDEAYWVHFTVSPERAPSVPTLPEQDDDGNAEAEADENRRLADAVAVDARLSPWLFGITQRRFDDLTPRLEDLLAPLPDDETGPDQ